MSSEKVTMKMMKQQVINEAKKIEFHTVPIPECNKNEVLVKIMRIGVCGSDIHVFYGKHPNTSFPVTQGHEVSGEIVEIGEEVKEFQIGDKVTIQPQITCGECYSCLHGNYHICDKLKVMGFQSQGTASEYFVIDQSYIIKLPAELNYNQGAMIEPVAVACSAIRKINNIEGKKIIVLGGGPIGNLTAQVAKALGANSILLTEVNDFRLKLAKEVGIDFVVNPAKVNLTDEIKKCFGADKADVIIECVGLESTVDTALQNARKGTEIILVGVFGEKTTIDLNVIQNSELRLIGVLMYQKQDYLKAIELVSTNKIDVESLITNHFPFLEYQRAYEYIEKNREKVMKVMIDVNE